MKRVVVVCVLLLLTALALSPEAQGQFWVLVNGALQYTGRVTINGPLTVTGTCTGCAAAGSGDVVGPASSVDNAITRFDGTTGKAVQDYTSGAPTVSDTGTVTIPIAVSAPIHTMPTAGTPFTLHVGSTVFNTTRDDISYWGYNLVGGNTSALVTPGEAQFKIAIEADYNDGADHWIENNWDYVGTDGTTIARPLSMTISRSTHKANWNVNADFLRVYDTTGIDVISTQRRIGTTNQFDFWLGPTQGATPLLRLMQPGQSNPYLWVSSAFHLNVGLNAVDTGLLNVNGAITAAGDVTLSTGNFRTANLRLRENGAGYEIDSGTDSDWRDLKVRGFTATSGINANSGVTVLTGTGITYPSWLAYQSSASYYVRDTVNGVMTLTVGAGTAGNGSLSVSGGVTAYVLTLQEAGNIIVGTTTGTKIGTATTQKLGFYNATPVVQGASVADATDAGSAITQLNALISRLEATGLIATTP